MQPTLHHATQDPPLLSSNVSTAAARPSALPLIWVSERLILLQGCWGKRCHKGNVCIPSGTGRLWPFTSSVEPAWEIHAWAELCLSLNSYSYFWFLREVMGCDADLNTSSQLKRLLKESSGPKGHKGLCSNSQHPIAIPSTQPVWEPSDSPISRKGFASTSRTPLALQ